MSERYIITFTEGGVGLLEIFATGGPAVVTEKALDTVTGDANRGWYCKENKGLRRLKVYSLPSLIRMSHL